MYTVHLLLIYGNFATFNFAKTINHSFGYLEALVSTLVLLGVMYGLAYYWETVKKGPPRVKTALQYGIFLALVGVFFFGPGQ